MMEYLHKINSFKKRFLKQLKNNDKDEGSLLMVCWLVNMDYKAQKVQGFFYYSFFNVY